jgi:hypothetical protein
MPFVTATAAGSTASIAGAVLYARNTLLIPLEWLFVSLRVVWFGLFAVKLVIAGFIYVWRPGSAAPLER